LCFYIYIDSIILQLIEWNIGLLKLDAVSPGSDDTYGIDNRLDVAAFSDSISRLDADIWLIISWKINHTFANDFYPYANSWRTSDDIDCYCNVLSAWHAVRNRFIEVIPWLNFLPSTLSNGGFPDLDSLNVLQNEFDGLTNDEKQTSATLWAIVGSPIYTGNDLVNGTDPFGLMLLTNEEVLSINDQAIKPILSPSSMNGTSDIQIWYSASSISNDIFNVALFNLGNITSDITLLFSEIKGLSLNNPICVRDVWLRIDIECIKNGFYIIKSLPSHGSTLLKLDASGGACCTRS